MAKKHPFAPKPEYGKHLALSAVRDQSTPEGSSKENDEMRRIQIHANALSDRLGKVEAGAAAPVTPAPAAPAETPKPPKVPTAKALVTEHNSQVIVDPTNYLNFIDDDVKFFVARDGDRANVKAKQPLTVQDDHVSVLSRPPGIFDTVKFIDFVSTSGTNGIDFTVTNESYDRVQVTASGTNHLYTAYKWIDGGTTSPQFVGDTGYIVNSGTSMLYFFGDSYNFEGVWPTMSGAGHDYPTLWVWPILNNDDPDWLNLTEYPYRDLGQTTRIRYRVTPVLKVFDPDESKYSSDHTTRLFFKESDTVLPHVDVDDPVADGLYPGGVDPRTYAAKISFDVKDNAFSMDNLGASGVNIGEVYATQSGTTFWLRRIHAIGALTLTEDGEYITLSGISSGDAYTAANYGSGTGVYKDTTGTGPFQFNFWTLLAGSGIEINLTSSGIEFVSTASGGTGVEYLVDNVGSGTGQVYRDSTLGDPTTFHLKTILGGDNVFVTNQANEILLETWGYSANASGICISASTPYNFYWKTITGTNSKQFEFRNFGIANDITMTVCSGGAYILDSNLNGQNVGSGTDVFYNKDGVGHYLQFRRLLGAGGVDVYVSDDDLSIVISGTISASDILHYSQNNVGGGEHVYRDTTGSGTLGNPFVFNERTLSGIGSVHTSTSGDVILISGTDHTYAVDNIGGAYEVYKNSSGDPTTFHLRTISGIGTVAVSYLGDVILVSGMPSNTYSGTNLGTGEGVYLDTVSFVHEFRSIKAGANITISGTGTEIIINGLAASGTISYDIDNVGGGNGTIYRDKTLGDPIVFHLKTISGAGNITIFNNADEIVVSGTDNDHTYDILNLGSGLQWYKNTTSGTPDVFNLRTVSGIGSVHTYYSGDDNVILISGTDTNNLYEVDNVGTGEGHVWRNTTSGITSVFHLKTIKAGTNVTVDDNADDITINSIIADDLYTFRNVGADTGEIYLNTRTAGGSATGFDIVAPGAPGSNGEYYCTTTTSGTGTGMTVLVIKDAFGINVYIVDPGEGYVVGDWITIIGYGGDDSTARISTVTDSRVVNLKTLSVDGDLYASQTDYHILFHHTITGRNVGGGEGVWKSKSSSNGDVILDFRSLIGAGTITLISGTNTITISGTAGAGNTYDMDNVGSGTGQVWRDTTTSGVNSTFNLKTILGSDNIFVTDQTNEILIETWGYSANASGVCGIAATPYNFYWKTVTGTNSKEFEFRNFQVSNDLVINVCSGGAYIFDVNIQGANVGGGYEAYYGKVGSNLQFRTFSGAGSVNVQYDDITGELIVISGTEGLTLYYAMDNVGAGEQVYRDVDGTGTIGDPFVFHERTLSGVGNVQTSTVGDVILISGTGGLYAMVNSSGTGTGLIYESTTLSGSTNVFTVRRLLAGSRMGVTTTGDDIFLQPTDQSPYFGHNAANYYQRPKLDFLDRSNSSTLDGIIWGHTDNFYSDNAVEVSGTTKAYIYNNIGGGSGIWKDTTIDGSDFRNVNLRTISGAGTVFVSLSGDGNAVVVSGTAFNLTTSIGGVTNSNISTLEFDDNAYDITWQDNGTAGGTAKAKARWKNYNTSWDTPTMFSGGVNYSEMICTNNTWYELGFLNEVLEDTPNWIIYASGTSWRFQPDDAVDFTWHVKVQLSIVSRYPTANTSKASIAYPEIALFIGNTFWRVLDVDENVGGFAQLRQSLLDSGYISGSIVLEAGSKAFLEGDALARLFNNSDQLNVRFKHNTGSDRYIKILDGFIDIFKTGEHGDQVNAQSLETDYTQN